MAGWNSDLKRVTSRSAGDWAQDAKACPRIVILRRKHDGRAMATLLMAKRGIKIDPDEVTCVGAIVTRLRCQQAVPTRVQNGDFLA